MAFAIFESQQPDVSCTPSAIYETGLLLLWLMRLSQSQHNAPACMHTKLEQHCLPKTFVGPHCLDFEYLLGDSVYIEQKVGVGEAKQLLESLASLQCTEATGSMSSVGAATEVE